MSTEQNLTRMVGSNETILAQEPSGMYIITAISAIGDTRKWENLIPSHQWLGNHVILCQSKQAKSSKKGYAIFHVKPESRKHVQHILNELRKFGHSAELNIIEVNLS
jgi:hypothetical protein